MTVKEWLNRGYKIDAEIEELKREHDRAFWAATSVTGGMSSARVQTSDSNTAERKMIRAAEYACMLDGRVAELYRVKKEILAVINKVGDNTLRQLLTLRYVRYFTWERCAEKMGYSREWVTKRLHPRALEAVKKQLNDDLF